MSGSSIRYPELLGLGSEAGRHILKVAAPIDGAVLHFVIDKEAKSSVAMILNHRPFDNLEPNCRYFFVPKGRKAANSALCSIRIEQGNRGKEFEFSMPLELAQNLMWLTQVQSPEDYEYLRKQP